MTYSTSDSVATLLTALQNMEGINGMSDLASVIGSPAQVTDPMATMVQNIQNAKNNLSAITGESSNDSLQSLTTNPSLGAINGLIKSYTVQAGTINIGDFVDYVNSTTVRKHVTYSQTNNSISSMTREGGNTSAAIVANAVKISNTQVLIVYNQGNVCFSILTISNGTITMNSVYQLTSVASTYSNILKVKMVNATTGIVFMQSGGTPYYCTFSVSGTVVQAGVTGQVSTYSAINGDICINGNTVVFYYNDSGNYRTLLRAGTISGTTLTLGTETVLKSTGTPTPQASQIKCIDSVNNVFIVAMSWASGSSYVYVYTFSVNSTNSIGTIATGTLAGNYAGWSTAFKVFSPTSVAMIIYDQTNKWIAECLLTISGATISFSAINILLAITLTSTGNGMLVSDDYLSNYGTNYLILAYAASTTSIQYAFLSYDTNYNFKVLGTQTQTINTAYNCINVIAVDYDTFFISGCDTGYYFDGALYSVSDSKLGVAKTSGSAGATIQVTI